MTSSTRGQAAATAAVFEAPDALGWAYQYWNTEEKQRVFDQAAGKGLDRKRHKIEQADIVPATQLYTEPYMVQFLVQNSLGGLWASMHSMSPLMAKWPYFVRAADRSRAVPRPVREITFLDPACGSGHFLLEAFDLFFSMYREEDPKRDAVQIAGDILRYNLHGLDIDERAVHIAEVSLWMKAAEAATVENRGAPLDARANLVATNVHLPKDGGHLDRFLEKHPEDEPLRMPLGVVFTGLEHADELGALLLLDEPVDQELRRIKAESDLDAANAVAAAQLRLFRDGEQSVLPLSARTFEDWRGDVLSRVRDHFAQEARSADPVQAFFGRSVERALDVFDVLSQRYDVVAANPPYMGSKNMGHVLRKHVEKYFPAGKRDLYAAFILRCRGLLATGGRTAIVAPQAWLFMRSYVGMRAVPVEGQTHKFTGLLAETAVETLAQLGRHAFREADPPGNVAMFVLHADAPEPSHEPVCFRLALPRPADEQGRLLAQAVSGDLGGLTWRPIQRAFLDIPQAPFCYWLRPRFLRLFAGKTVSDVGEVRQGMATAEDGRFLRFGWELADPGTRWFPFYKGGGYRKWDGLVNLVVDWESAGARIRQTPGPRIQGEPFFRGGWTYSRMARGRMGVRRQNPPGVIADKGPGIYLRDDGFIPALNSRAFSHMLRAVSPNMAFEVDVVSRGPIPTAAPEVNVSVLVAAKARLTATDLTERAFTNVADLPTVLAWCAELHTLEGESERAVMRAYGLDEDDVAAVLADTGVPASWLSDEVDDATRARLRALFEAGPGGDVDSTDDRGADDDGDEEGEDVQDLGTGRPIHPETFLEELCEKAGVSPMAAWRAIEAGLAAGWRCAAEERRLAADRVSVSVLRLLGHRWPVDIERGEPVPGWADEDGVVPLTSIPHERPLIERLRERWSMEDVSEAELSSALEMPVDSWLHTRFAAWHTSQFKRRPVAWQVESSHGRRPAFSALLNAQQVSAEMLASIRSQYVGPLLERRRQEVRTLEGAEKRSADQEQRLKDIALAISELERFADALVSIEREGFATPGLRAIAVQDAVQSLVRPVLARWRAELVQAPVREWAADARAVDESLAVALDEAVEVLPQGCGEWAALVRAPEWSQEAPDAHAICSAVLDVAEPLGATVADALARAVENAFGKWKRARREDAAGLGSRVPKFKAEDAKVEALARRVRGWRPETKTLPRFLAGLPLLDAWCAEPNRSAPTTLVDFVRQESAWRPDVNDGVRVNIASLQRAGLLRDNPLAEKDIEPAIADRAVWRADERRWVRSGRLPRPGWWPRGTL